MTPSKSHGIAQLELGFILKKYKEKFGVSIVGTDITLPTAKGVSSRDPDIIGYSSDDEVQVVFEVSKSTQKEDYGAKLTFYQGFQIPNYIIADLKLESVSHFKLKNKKYIQVNDSDLTDFYKEIKNIIQEVKKYD